MSQDNVSIDVSLLEAQGQLNRQIQASLQQFRRKLLAKASPTKKRISKPYQQFKEGPQKRFIFRQSLLSIMFEINDFRTIYNMMMASFIILTISLLYSSYMKSGQLLDIISFLQFFKGWKSVLLAWVVQALIHSSIILITKISLKVKYFIWIPIYLLQISSLIMTAAYFSKTQGLGFGSIMIIMAQSIRMIMKGHSYLRTKLLYITENPYKHFQFKGISIVNSNGKGEQELKNQSEENSKQKIQKISIKNEDIFSQIKKLSYFLFAPTLIYRDQYTLTPVRSIRKIFAHFINFLACVYYSFMLYQSWCKPVIENLQNNLDFVSLVSAIINLMMPSVLFLILGFFGFLHSWLNLWSQITRFPDRAFYSDWWNSCEFGSYYRKWNIVVHDWLYYYIYLDLYRLLPQLKKVRAVPQLLTFVISAIIHEFIIYYAIGFFYPILFILFAGPGILFVQSKSLRKTSVNLIFWLQMYIGTSMMFTFYLVQCFARNKISDEFIQSHWGSLGYLIPRTFYLGQ